MSGPLPALAAPLAVPASWLWGAVTAARNARYDRGRGVTAIGVPVISVGNLTAGGSGKTPVVDWIARRLLAGGCRPVIAMRGYGARRGEMSDEQQEHMARLPEVPVLADPDRAGALRAFLPGHPDIGCVLLDDGFQHRRLARDLDLVLIDATRDALHDRFLPAGWLRERPAALRRAGAVVVTRAAGVDAALAGGIERHHGRPPIAWSRHVWTGLRVMAGGGAERCEPAAWLAGRNVVTLLGVGNPRAVREQVEAAGAAVVADVPARDHQRYSRAVIDRVGGLCRGADALVMTGKDWARARRLIDLATWPVPIVVPRLEIEVFQGAAELESAVWGAVRGRRG